LLFIKGKIGDAARINHIKECIDEIVVALTGLTYDTFSENHVLRIAIVK
jgi:uncharacterized protein with HEPN domain